MDKLRDKIKKIELSEDAKQRILQHCTEKIKLEQENYCMKKNIITKYKKPLVAAAAFAVCLCLTGITAMATTGKGFFRDIVQFDGAITGQTYENATDEVLVYAAVEEDMLNVTVEMVKIEMVPYREIEVLELEKYRVYDCNGTVVMENVVPDNVITENNQVKFMIPAEGLAKGTYKLELDVLCGSKKAEQDLLIYGGWECEFTK